MSLRTNSPATSIHEVSVDPAQVMWKLNTIRTFNNLGTDNAGVVRIEDRLRGCVKSVVLLRFVASVEVAGITSFQPL